MTCFEPADSGFYLVRSSFDLLFVFSYLVVLDFFIGDAGSSLTSGSLVSRSWALTLLLRLRSAWIGSSYLASIPDFTLSEGDISVYLGAGVNLLPACDPVFFLIENASGDFYSSFLVDFTTSVFLVSSFLTSFLVDSCFFMVSGLFVLRVVEGDYFI